MHIPYAGSLKILLLVVNGNGCAFKEAKEAKKANAALLANESEIT
jgi:hypothetical protein